MKRRTTTLLLAVCLAAGLAVGETPPDLDDLLAAAVEANTLDRSAWTGYSFKRHVLRQKLDTAGEVEWRQEMLFQNTPTAGGFDEILISMDGQPPSDSDVKKHRRAGRFQERYESSTELALDNPIGPDLELLPLLLDQEHRYVGEESVDGTACHRIAFSARKSPGADAPVPERLKHAMEGSMCISSDTSRLMAAELQTARPIAVGRKKIDQMRIVFAARPVNEIYLPSRIEIVSYVAIPGKKFRSHNVYRFTDFRKP